MSIISRLLDIENELDSFGDEFTFGPAAFGHNTSPRLRASLLPMLFSHGGRRRHNPYAMTEKNPKRTRVERLRPSIVGKDGFEISINVDQFKPEEITVKTVDNAVIVEGRHEEREDEHGFISRHFVRRYPLPKDYDPEQVVSTLSADGFLTVKAPPPKTAQNERIVQIQLTGRAHEERLKTSSESETREEKVEENGEKNGEEQDKVED